MPTRFVCLANSFKEGGSCIAGIELDANNNPRFENAHPKWIRPICNTPHGEVHTHLVSHIHILDIVEIEISGFPEERNYQSENSFFMETSIRVVGRFDGNQLDRLCENRNLIFGNRGKAVSAESIGNLSYSLMFVKPLQFEVNQKTYEGNPGPPQIRLIFTYKENRYDLPVTDPIFLNSYRTDPQVLDACNQLYLCLSLSVVWNDWYYKLVAGTIMINA
jgi:hypothetical protein